MVSSISTFLSLMHTNRTGKYRQAAGVEFPNPYAPAAEAAVSPTKFRFNCAQKAHANFTENHTSFLTVILIAGLHYPRASAALGSAWILARFLYLVGYTRKQNAERGKGRHLGTWWAVPHLVLMGLACVSSWKIMKA
ncbi:Microsomal glutathione S-transferase 3 [Talaromyces pinophilus]|nr:Microsomal glutathione S-transferase 3 [Talaromyces pinophilus]